METQKTSRSLPSWCRVRNLRDLRIEYRRQSHRVQHFARNVQRDTLYYMKLNLSPAATQTKEQLSDGRHVVVLLYGFGGTQRIFRVLERRLLRDGFGVVTFHLGGLFNTFNTGGIQELAENVGDQIDLLCRQHNLKRVSIVAHSKGGLIAAYLVKRLGGDYWVDRIVTLGTPHNGTPLAMWGVLTIGAFARSVWQMTPMSPFIADLRKYVLPRHVRLVSIYSRSDRICPYPYCRLDESVGNGIKNVEVSDVSHTGMVIRKRVYDIIRRELQSAKAA